MVSPTDAIKLSAEAKKLYIESAAQSIEQLVEYVERDEEFSAALAKDPRNTLGKAGISLEKEAIELLISVDPERFDSACDKLFQVLDPDLLAKMVAPSCDGSLGITNRSKYELRSSPSNF